MTALSLSEFDRVYARLGVSFDEVRGEAFYESYLDQTVQRIVDAGITEESEGALVVSLKQFGETCPPASCARLMAQPSTPPGIWPRSSTAGNFTPLNAACMW